ncbi:unnamed protein product [Enterobius vermicularis]|uniref:Nicotinate phosphoribosyltransferase n=1 Tax=Enterobius vermicularis TaxID=51028 RepID=A0A0N4V3R9_ENTVE|nr:unnamed protein product [Enterobius vermicularis]
MVARNLSTDIQDDSVIQTLLTDLYQITMCYGYWKAGVHEQNCVFDVFFRKNPFGGEYTIFAGLEDCLRFLDKFKFKKTDVDFLRKVLPNNIDPEFFDYLLGLNAKGVKVSALKEGSVVFPRVPMITVEGPLAVCQIFETIFLNLVSFASLVTTNASRLRYVAGDKQKLYEFGLRRAQGPNGALSASKYSYVGGFDGTSNVLAGERFNIPVFGTHAHSFISAFSSPSDLKVRKMKNASGTEEYDLYELAKTKLEFLTGKFSWGVSNHEISAGELCAFCAYAVAFPSSFLVLVDTYDVLKSGIINFCAVTLALFDLGYRAIGIRIDSGDLSYLSQQVRSKFKMVAGLDPQYSWISKLTIFASNSVNEDTISSLNEQHHEIDGFGIGGNLVTCYKQSSLGCVYKLVTLEGNPKIKLSEDVGKITIPGKKRCYRLYGRTGLAVCDLMMLDDEEPPKEHHPILCRHPFVESKRAEVVPHKVECLQQYYYGDGELHMPLPTLEEIRRHTADSLQTLRSDHRRLLNPTPYKVSLSVKLYAFLHNIWLENAPIGRLE